MAVVCCVLFGVDCCLLFVVRCVLFVVGRCVFFVGVCCLFCVVFSCSWFVVGRLLFAVWCWPSFFFCCLSVLVVCFYLFHGSCLVSGCCVLFAARWVPSAALVVARCLLCCLQVVIRVLLFVVCCMLSVVRCLLSVVCCLLAVAR